LIELTKLAQGKFKNEERFLFEQTKIDEAAFIDDSDQNFQPFINIGIDDFNNIFSNIVTNALDHGFRDEKKKYVIRTFIGLENDMCVLEVSNNGKSIDPSFKLINLITRGEKTTDSLGIGSGGADINLIVEKYKGKFDLENNQENEFPVKYILKFPILKSNIL
jgi:type I restriction enzyme M protein